MRALLLLALSASVAAQDEMPAACQDFLTLAEEMDRAALAPLAEDDDADEAARARLQENSLVANGQRRLHELDEHLDDDGLQRWCEEAQRRFHALIRARPQYYGRLAEELAEAHEPPPPEPEARADAQP